MTPIITLSIIIVSAAVAMALYSRRQYGHVRNWRDWVPAIIAVIALSLLLTVIARAETLAYTQVYFGLEYPDYKGHPACEIGDNQITSNIGISQNLYRLTDGPASIDVNGTYRHHSCAIGDDDRVTDTLGVNVVFTIDW